MGGRAGNNLCGQAEGAETENTWTYVGDGIGDTDCKETMNYVGDGLGSWEKQTVTTYAGMRLRPWVVCASSLLAVFLGLCLTGTVARMFLGVAGSNSGISTATGGNTGESVTAVRVTASPGAVAPAGDASAGSDSYAAAAAVAITGNIDVPTEASTTLPSSEGEQARHHSPCTCPGHGSREQSCLCAKEDACGIARKDRTFKQVVLCRLQRGPTQGQHWSNSQRLPARTTSPALESFSTASPAPFDCLSHEVFAEEKRRWCCTNKHLGCTTTKEPLRRRGLLRMRSP